ncbi:Cobyrinic acid ac-diamide synthase [Oceanococcus atlanticus]|uniref:Cobyrinic acid ac-diamide synthase n=1 Tax=Oceanococcus atlanticus TaxID=1317117 RepID=A0A1Y1SIA4_9GAMM|nr:AAA family ATPase [Oceanococcus atlanticus]ORE89376.1 Cobyrinic acid ac-diamide synthase [Oceanococcus atlanticus]RZO84976.1 MAG: ParA family protein [Oceanococcus sp.]
MKVVACYSMKGGVGKTATAVNLSYWAASQGLRTLLIDLDAQGASSFYFRVKPGRKKWGKRFFQAYENVLEQIRASDFEGLDVLPAHLSFRNFDALLASLEKRKSRLRRILKGLKGEYDLIVLDCPPTISHLSESVFNAADMVLVPVIPTTLSQRTFEQLLAFFAEKGYAREVVVPFFSMVQRQKALHKSTMTHMRQRHKGFLQAVIPFARDIENMGEHRAPVAVFAARKPATKAYLAMFDELWPSLRPKGKKR